MKLTKTGEINMLTRIKSFMCEKVEFPMWSVILDAVLLLTILIIIL